MFSVSAEGNSVGAGASVDKRGIAVRDNSIVAHTADKRELAAGIGNFVVTDTRVEVNSLAGICNGIAAGERVNRGVGRFILVFVSRRRQADRLKIVGDFDNVIFDFQFSERNGFERNSAGSAVANVKD